MDKWAQQYGQQAHFLCIGCAGPQAAKMMKDRLSLRHCSVGYCSQSQMPSWGQLGCNGFIVIDNSSQQRVISKATAPFNMVRELGFKHVETLVDAMIARRAIPAVCPGQVVRLRNLQQAQLNNQLGLCVDNRQNDRFPIQLLQARKIVSVRANNFVVVEDVEAALSGRPESSVSSNSGCSNGQCGDVSFSSDPCESGEKSCDGPCQQDDEAEDTPVRPMQHVASVDVPEMDDEHEDCVTALNLLATERTRASLANAITVVQDHFSHEEKLLDTTMYQSVSSSSTGGFSADANSRKTHFADHARIISVMRSGLANQRVSTQLIRGIMNEFEKHAGMYDTYGARVAAAC